MAKSKLIHTSNGAGIGGLSGGLIKVYSDKVRVEGYNPHGGNYSKESIEYFKKVNAREILIKIKESELMRLPVPYNEIQPLTKALRQISKELVEEEPVAKPGLVRSLLSKLMK